MVDGSKVTMAERRAWFMQCIAEWAQREQWKQAYDAVVMVGPLLGRSERWQNACSWLKDQKDAGRELNWIVLQGSVFLAHANT